MKNLAVFTLIIVAGCTSTKNSADIMAEQAVKSKERVEVKVITSSEEKHSVDLVSKSF